MIPLGYMMKRVAMRDDWLKQPKVQDIFSVSACTSKDFCDDWINEWKHNGYWLFDSSEIVRDIALKRNLNPDELTLFYYEAHETQYNADTRQWEPFALLTTSYDPRTRQSKTHATPYPGFPLNIKPPARNILQGYDIVASGGCITHGCSPLSCNGLAEKIPVNAHCLLDDLQTAKTLLKTGVIGTIEKCEPGPYRIIAVHTLN